MKYEGKFSVTFKDNGDIDTIGFPKHVESFPNKQEWNNYSLWESRGRDERMYALTTQAEKNIDDVCNEFAKRGFIGCKKSGKRKLTSIRYVLLTSLGGYEFVKN